MLNRPVAGEAILLRGVTPARLPIIGGGKTLPASDTWSPSTDDKGSSCFILGADVTAETVCDRGPWPAVVSIRVSDLRGISVPGVEASLEAIHDALEDGTPCGDAHALVIGWPTGNTHRKKMLKAVVNASTWIGEPVFRKNQ